MDGIRLCNGTFEVVDGGSYHKQKQQWTIHEGTEVAGFVGSLTEPTTRNEGSPSSIVARG